MLKKRRGSIKADITMNDISQTAFRNVSLSTQQSNIITAMKLPKETEKRLHIVENNIKSYIVEKFHNYTQGTSLHGVKHITKSDSSIQCR